MDTHARMPGFAHLCRLLASPIHRYVPRLCARLRHQAVEVSFVDLPNFFRQQLARVGTQDPAERPGSVFAKNMTMGIMGAAHNTVHVATS